MARWAQVQVRATVNFAVRLADKETLESAVKRVMRDYKKRMHEPTVLRVTEQHSLTAEIGNSETNYWIEK